MTQAAPEGNPGLVDEGTVFQYTTMQHNFIVHGVEFLFD